MSQLPIGKSNGDTLTAEEFNQLTGAVAGDKLPYDPNTGQPVTDQYGVGSPDNKIKHINGIDINAYQSMIGEIKTGLWRYPDQIPALHVAMVGQVLSRVDYVQLFQFFINNGVKVRDVSNNLVTVDASGDGSTTFHMPNIVDGDGGGRFFKFVNSQNHVLGEVQEDSTKLPNNGFTGVTSANGAHTHSVNYNKDSVFEGVGTIQLSDNISGTTSNNGILSAGNHTHTTSITGGGDAVTQPHSFNVTAILFTGV